MQDKIIKASGKLSAKDRNGNITEELKVLADEISEVTMETRNNYQSNGEALPPPAQPTVKAKRRPSTGGGGGGYAKHENTGGFKTPTATKDPPAPPPYVGPPRTLYVHVRNPADHDGLLKLKRSLNDFPGSSSAILVLGEDKKSAIKLPFTINPHDALLSSIRQLYGEECVILK